MDTTYPEVPVELMNLFHEKDRKLYSILVFELKHDPKVSVNMIALWIWLEQNKIIKHAVHKIMSSSMKLINGLANEAAACLRCITDANYLFSSDASEISLTQNVLGKQLSLKFFHENRANALCGIRMVMENVCVKVLEDLMKMAITRNTERELLKTQMVMMPPSEPMDPMIPRFGGLVLTGESSRSVVPPMDPMIQKFGGLEVTGESSRVPMEEPKDERIMFATFSKGYPISKCELWDYLKRKFGEYSVESISMQVVKPNEQSLFALIVFTSSAIVDLVLRGMEKAKFKIKGKRVWMRKFIPKAEEPL